MSLNDLFVVACAEAALSQHERAGVELASLTCSVVVGRNKTPSSDTRPSNAFLPVAVSLPGTGALATDRLSAVHRQIATKRAQLDEHGDLLGAVGAVSSLMPPALATALALSQAQRIDFATSNLPGLPFDAWIGGRRIESLIPMGPVAGTAFNATLLSSTDEAVIGLHIDPACIPDSDALRADLRAGFATLGLTGVVR